MGNDGRRVDFVAAKCGRGVAELITDAVKVVMMAVELILLPQSVVGVLQS